MLTSSSAPKYVITTEKPFFCSKQHTQTHTHTYTHTDTHKHTHTHTQTQTNELTNKQAKEQLTTVASPKAKAVISVGNGVPTIKRNFGSRYQCKIHFFFLILRSHVMTLENVQLERPLLGKTEGIRVSAKCQIYRVSSC